jgi:hypothetical protein
MASKQQDQEGVDTSSLKCLATGFFLGPDQQNLR